MKENLATVYDKKELEISVQNVDYNQIQRYSYPRSWGLNEILAYRIHSISVFVVVVFEIIYSLGNKEYWWFLL